MGNSTNNSIWVGYARATLCKRSACQEPYRLGYLNDLAEAKTWLQRFKADDSAILLVRAILSDEAGWLPLFRMSDDSILEQFALLLNRRIWHVHTIPYPVATNRETAEVQEAGDRPVSSTAAPRRDFVPEIEETTLAANADEEKIAGVLKAAADAGIPFCEECAKETEQ